MFQDAAPLPVNAPVTLVANDQIEISRGIIPVDVDHALQRRDGDLLLILEAPARTQHITGIIRQMLGKGVFRLLGEWYPVHQEQHPSNRVSLKHAFHEGRRRAGFACPRRHLNQELTTALSYLAAQGVDAILLKISSVAPGYALVDGHSERVLPHLACGKTPFQGRAV